MHLLALDTSGPRISVAIGHNGRLRAEVSIDGARRHAEQVAPAIEFLCASVGIEPAGFGAVAVGIGPGLFTGLRVGVTTARAIAQCLRIPVVGVPSLDLVAYPLRHTTRLVVAVTDARRHEVFYACYRPVPGGVQRVTDYAVGPAEALVGELTARGEEVLLAGDGALLHGEAFGALDRVELAGPDGAFPSAAALVELASARLEREEFETAADVHPLYLRRSDAEILWDAKAH
jgi:tRNA threonylcarbamoyladenosine biosynthesis protein TsaB